MHVTHSPPGTQAKQLAGHSHGPCVDGEVVRLPPTHKVGSAVVVFVLKKEKEGQTVNERLKVILP